MRRHELDPLSLVFGFLFTAFGLLFLVGQPEAAVRLRWLWPVLLLGLGLAILLGARPRRPSEPAAEPAAGDLQEPSGAGAAAVEPAGTEPTGADQTGHEATGDEETSADQTGADQTGAELARDDPTGPPQRPPR